MRNKIVVLITEIVGLNLLTLFFIWKLYISPNLVGNMPAGNEFVRDTVYNGMMIFIVVFLLIMSAAGFQAYYYIWLPYKKKIDEMEAAAQESKEAEIIRKEFVANVSHELKTPLTSISGFIETLQAGAAEEPEIRARFLDIIAIETSRLKRLIEDLLVLSDIENKREYEWEEFDVQEALERTIEVLQPIAEKKKLV